MKYSLRSLMIVVTLIAVVLGGVMGRIEYLSRWAEFHRREANKDVARLNAWEAEGRKIDSEYADLTHSLGRHVVIGRRYERAVYRPWAIVDDSL